MCICIVFKTTILDKNVETKGDFCNFLLNLSPVNLNSPLSTRSNVGFVVLSFLLQNHAFNIELGEMGLFFKGK